MIVYPKTRTPYKAGHLFESTYPLSSPAKISPFLHRNQLLPTLAQSQDDYSLQHHLPRPSPTLANFDQPEHVNRGASKFCGPRRPAEPSPVLYAHLDATETSFEAVDLATTTYQHILARPAYARRAALTSRISHFWPLVLEESPVEIDQHIQPSDSALFASSLLSLHVDRFEVPTDSANLPASLAKLASTAAQEEDADVTSLVRGERMGEPRSLLFRFEFAPNEHFEDHVLEKRFWHRKAKSGWSGRVSEPVRIHWKKGRDLTDGLTDAACDLYEAQQASGKTSGDDAKSLPQYQALLDEVDASTEGGLSFFSWFGYRGPWVSAEESGEASGDTGGASGKGKSKAPADENTADDATDPTPASEIFPDGEDVALALAEDVWPNALRYFMAAQEEGNDGEDDDDEVEGLSEGSFDEAEMMEEMDASDEEQAAGVDEGRENMEMLRGLARKNGDEVGRPSKKRKA